MPTNLSDPEQINRNFTQFVTETNDNCNNLILNYSQTFFKPNISFSFWMIDKNNINNIILSLKKNSTGADSLSLRLVLYCYPFIENYLVHIFNYCIEKGYFPGAWKQALGIPFPKNNKPTCYSDLRIISKLFYSISY